MSNAADSQREDILAACLQAAERGDSGTIERACRDHAGLAADIRSVVEAVRSLGAHAAQPARVAVPLDVAVPAHVGRFEILREIGRGGSSLVWLARDPKLDRLVALKVLALQPTREALERFRREAHALAQLRHPNIAAVHDAGETEAGLPYLAMDYIDGTSLAAVLQRLAGRDPRELCPEDVPFAADAQPTSFVTAVVRWLAKIADALAHAHAAGLIHRDVKPANILIDRRGEPYLVDFGLARGADAHTVTRTGVAAGTPLYMAPEQVSQGRGPIGPPSDIYALGVTLYHALTLRAPFGGETTEQVFDQICRVEAVPLRRLNPDVPRDLEIVVLKAMEKDPARRYPGATALREDLEALLALRPIKARPPGRLERGRKWARRNPKLAAALAVAVVVLAGSWVWRMWQVRAEGYAALASFQRDQAKLDREQAELAPRVASLAGFVPTDERGRIAAAQAELEARRLATEKDLVQACDRLAEALDSTRWLTPLNGELRRRLCGALVARGRQVADRGNEIDARACLDRAQQVAGDDWQDWTWGRVRLASAAPSSVAWLFRYEPYELGRLSSIPRLVPVPVDRDGNLLDRELAPGFACGDHCLLVDSVEPDGVAARAGVAAGDLIHRIGDDDLREPRLYVASVAPGGEADWNGVQPFDRILDVNGRAAIGMWTWELSPHSGTEPVSAMSCTIQSPEGRRRQVEACVPFPDEGLLPWFPDQVVPTKSKLDRIDVSGLPTAESALGFTPGELPDLMRLGPVRDIDLSFWHDGQSRDATWPAGRPFGASVEWTAYPLARGAKNRLDVDERPVLRLGPGSYLALFEAPERGAVRKPFVVETSAGSAGGVAEVSVDPPRNADVPPGFIYVPGGDFLSQGEPDVTVPEARHRDHVEPFFISRLEVSWREWLEFANDVASPDADLDTSGMSDIRARGLPVPQNVQGNCWAMIFNGRWIPQNQGDGGAPVVGVGEEGNAEAYVGWLSVRAKSTGWRYRLPTKLEWEIAARGVDGRSYPWGDRFDCSLCNSLFARDGTGALLCVQEPRGRFPCDESPYGVRDMAGGAVEQNAGNVNDWLSWTPWRGGSWVMVNPVYFKAASKVPSKSDFPERGLRLVAERVKG